MRISFLLKFICFKIFWNKNKIKKQNNKNPIIPVSDKISKYRLCGCVEHRGWVFADWSTTWISQLTLKFLNPTPFIGFNFQTCIPEEYNFPYDDCSKFINILYKSEYLSLMPGKFISSAKDIRVGIKIFNNRNFISKEKYKIQNQKF